jgi:hypothetical protein
MGPREWIEALTYILVHQTGLSHTAVTEDNDLERRLELVIGLPRRWCTTRKYLQEDLLPRSHDEEEARQLRSHVQEQIRRPTVARSWKCCRGREMCLERYRGCVQYRLIRALCWKMLKFAVYRLASGCWRLLEGRRLLRKQL